MKKVRGKYCAYAAVVRDEDFGLGLTCFRERGYVPLTNEGSFPTWDDANEKATGKNHDVLDVTAAQAEMIVITSMFPGSPITLADIINR